MSSLDEFSKTILVKTLLHDNKMKKEQRAFVEKGDIQNTLKYYTLRRQNFKKIAELSKTRHVDLTVQTFLNQQRGEMELELRIYQYQNELNLMIGEMLSKIDSLKQDLAVKEKRIERLEKILKKVRPDLSEIED
ncbi:hypothetical protein [Candidatus Nitrosocosmicus franklandus]|uniref:Uncharacterized protein n=1 Tax=Candidatus Nitrosocosmicus franklandianus TaxID=1798806 RepID=A0A484I8S2_9ARCH|nr:hypothetical protein [Candidatus Nitrosocosmicus franklandus]VFJ12390.1 protein of unknown function [Candidatus Nitrosocosmicus franklandus]